MYKGVNLKLATQRDLSKVLNLPIVLVSFEKNLSEEQERVLQDYLLLLKITIFMIYSLY